MIDWINAPPDINYHDPYLYYMSVLELRAFIPKLSNEDHLE